MSSFRMATTHFTVYMIQISLQLEMRTMCMGKLHTQTKIKSVESKIQEYRLTWRKHKSRIENTTILKIMIRSTTKTTKTSHKMSRLIKMSNWLQVN